MPDPRFFRTNAPLSLGEAVKIAHAAALGDADRDAKIVRVADLEEADLDGAVIYIDDASKTGRLKGRVFGLCLAPSGVGGEIAGGVVAVARDPKAAFGAVAATLHDDRTFDEKEAPSIDAGARVHPTAIVGPGARIGAGAAVGPFAVIGPGVVIGDDTVVEDHASVWCAMIGARCRVGAGAAIGGAGFGFAAGETGMARIPHLGRVLIGDDVEIGAHCCVDRGMLADTTIGSATKIDNLVQIGHNVRIGRACVLAAHVGIAGSATLEDGVQCGGQAGIADHLTIGAGARIAAKGGVISDVPPGETWGGYPARPMKTWLREVASARVEEKKRAKSHGD